MPIQWRKQMSVGNLIIDLDHRYLLCLINMVETAMLHPEDGVSLSETLAQLAEYAREHFDREERIQYRIRYQYYMEHKKHHQRLLARLDEISAAILDEKDPEQLKGRGDEIMVLLREWLLDHVLKEDMKMKKDLEISPPNLMG